MIQVVPIRVAELGILADDIKPFQFSFQHGRYHIGDGQAGAVRELGFPCC